MSINIKFTELWTYSIKTPPNQRDPSEKKLSIWFLDEKEFTHIHGDLTIEIDGKILPKMGYDSPSDVCFGYWIEELVRLFKAFAEGQREYTIHGMDQGMPSYLLSKNGQNVYLSVVQSLNGGKADPNWQQIELDLKEFKSAFLKFKNSLLDEIGSQSPNALEIWSVKFT